jgi:TolA-binding protein
MKLREAEDDARKVNLKSWPLAEHAAQDHIRNRAYDRAAQAYKDFIAVATPAKSPDLPRAYIALLEVRCMQSEIDKAVLIFNQFFELFQKDGPMLRACGNTIYPYFDRLKDKPARDRLLGLAEKALRAGIELPGDTNSRAQALFDLGMTLYYQDRFAEAVPVLRQSIESTRASSTQEDRQLRLADALRKSGDKTGATEIYDKLKNSERANVRESANYGLIAIRQSDTKP